MKESIEYKFVAPADRRKQARLQVDVPTEFVARVLRTDSVLGRALARHPDEAIVRETNNQNGTSTLDFLHTGMVGDWRSRLDRVFDAVVRLDGAARAFDRADPRIHLDDFLGFKERGFGISFQRPVGDDDEVAVKIRSGMTTAAKYLQGNISETKALASVGVDHDPRLGFRLHTHSRWIASSVWQVDSSDANRIEVSGGGGHDRNSFGYAVTFAGIVAALDPIEGDSA